MRPLFLRQYLRCRPPLGTRPSRREAGNPPLPTLHGTQNRPSHRARKTTVQTYYHQILEVRKLNLWPSNLSCQVKDVDLFFGDDEGVDLQVGEEQVHVHFVQADDELGNSTAEWKEKPERQTHRFYFLVTYAWFSSLSPERSSDLTLSSVRSFSSPTGISNFLALASTSPMSTPPSGVNRIVSAERWE